MTWTDEQIMVSRQAITGACWEIDKKGNKLRRPLSINEARAIAAEYEEPIRSSVENALIKIIHWRASGRDGKK